MVWMPVVRPIPQCSDAATSVSSYIHGHARGDEGYSTLTTTAQVLRVIFAVQARRVFVARESRRVGRCTCSPPSPPRGNPPSVEAGQLEQNVNSGGVPCNRRQISPGYGHTRISRYSYRDILTRDVRHQKRRTSSKNEHSEFSLTCVRLCGGAWAGVDDFLTARFPSRPNVSQCRLAAREPPAPSR